VAQHGFLFDWVTDGSASRCTSATKRATLALRSGFAGQVGHMAGNALAQLGRREARADDPRPLLLRTC